MPCLPCVPSTPPLQTEVELCGQEISMAGAAQSIASEQTYEDLVKAGCELTLEKMDSKLMMCTSE